MTLVCLTNDIPNLRSCTVRDQHQAHCNGFAWRYDRALEIDMPTNDECTGCLPRQAEHGLLCWSCWMRVTEAWSKAHDMITHLRSVDRAQQIDNGGVRADPGWVIPVPITWRMADELIMLLGHPAPGFPSDAVVEEIDVITERFIDDLDPEVWVSRPAGAEDALRFVVLMQTAIAGHPMDDREHRVVNVRCPECRLKALLWKPPLEAGDELDVTCTNCGYEMDHNRYEAVMTLQRLEPKTRKEA
ncbi:hypothetical protein SAMN04489834_3125 [Microterricola viridarii]|uniref:Uncharacterized protein n=2 Tax=Microterricola viridarii TaxID=412690 RepID=A0A1H1YL22_9MICO|nr:hypothetical protein SAMN04489834_3125 [Microterricola viridarii]